MGAPACVPGKSTPPTGSVANYRGTQAFAGSLTGAVGDDVYVTLSASGNTADGDVGTRGSVLFGF